MEPCWLRGDDHERVGSEIRLAGEGPASLHSPPLRFVRLDLPSPLALPSVEEDFNPFEFREVSAQITPEVNLVPCNDDQGLNPVAGWLAFRWLAFLCLMDPAMVKGSFGPLCRRGHPL